MSDTEAFADWLARTNYGIDYRQDEDPPITLRQLAEAYWRVYPTQDTTVEEWAWVITEETGAWKP